ncbi:hypothetical protein Tco_1070365 [Tanacetum coccineum]|uniref:Uncharacterized protein n=1 Tax=Tanacetum coccineum TaxID=301880 RepID=A0ABQ5HLA5_9ASTR
MTTLADKAILSGADNLPPMLEKDMYDSWKSINALNMLNRQKTKILESVKGGPLILPSDVKGDDLIDAINHTMSFLTAVVTSRYPTTQVVQAMPSSEQSNVVNHSETEITSDSNIIPYS